MNHTRPLFAALVVGGLALALAACSADTATAPRAVRPALERAVSSESAALVACPVDTSASASAVIGPRGGAVKVGRFALKVPPHAVAEPTTFTFDVPASPYLEIDVHAAGVAHYEFSRPVSVTIDYSRCGSGMRGMSFDAWYIDSATGALVAPMHGHNARGAELFVFDTDHLSRYAIAD